MAKDEGDKSFAVILSEIEHGELNVSLSEKFHGLISTLARHAESFGKAKGELHLTLKVNLDQGGTASLESETKVKEPKVVRPRSVFWLSAQNNLLTKDPKQLELPVRGVPSPHVAERDVGADQRETRGV